MLVAVMGCRNSKGVEGLSCIEMQSKERITMLCDMDGAELQDTQRAHSSSSGLSHHHRHCKPHLCNDSTESGPKPPPHTCQAGPTVLICSTRPPIPARAANVPKRLEIGDRRGWQGSQRSSRATPSQGNSCCCSSSLESSGSCGCGGIPSWHLRAIPRSQDPNHRLRVFRDV